MGRSRPRRTVSKANAMWGEGTSRCEPSGRRTVQDGQQACHGGCHGSLGQAVRCNGGPAGHGVFTLRVRGAPKCGCDTAVPAHANLH